MYADEIIVAALEAITVFNEVTDKKTLRLKPLNRMLRSWAVDPEMPPVITEISFSTVANQSAYTIGSGGDIDLSRPADLLSGFVRDGEGIDHHLEVIGRDEYQRKGVKTTGGRPFEVYYDPIVTLGKIHLYYRPTEVETVYLDVSNPLPEFADLDTTDYVIQPEYEEVLIYQLAIRLSTIYAKSLTAEAALLAKSTLDKLKANNREPAEIRQGSRRYNINEG